MHFLVARCAPPNAVSGLRRPPRRCRVYVSITARFMHFLVARCDRPARCRTATRTASRRLRHRRRPARRHTRTCRGYIAVMSRLLHVWFTVMLPVLHFRDMTVHSTRHGTDMISERDSPRIDEPGLLIVGDGRRNRRTATAPGSLDARTRPQGAFLLTPTPTRPRARPSRRAPTPPITVPSPADPRRGQPDPSPSRRPDPSLGIVTEEPRDPPDWPQPPHGLHRLDKAWRSVRNLAGSHHPHRHRPRSSSRRFHDPHRERAPAQRPPPATAATAATSEGSATPPRRPPRKARP